MFAGIYLTIKHFLYILALNPENPLGAASPDPALNFSVSNLFIVYMPANHKGASEETNHRAVSCAGELSSANDCKPQMEQKEKGAYASR